MIIPSILSFSVLGACAGGTPPGELPADQVALTDSPALAHLATAYPKASTVADLFERGLQPTAAPDPSAWYTHQRNVHATLPRLSSGTELRVLSYNVGLLDREYLLGRAFVPNLPERRERQIELLPSTMAGTY